jgi:hypothetical protein
MGYLSRTDAEADRTVFRLQEEKFDEIRGEA